MLSTCSHGLTCHPDDDHRPRPAPDLARWRRDRPSLVLPKGGRIRGRRRDLEVRLRRASTAPSPTTTSSSTRSWNASRRRRDSNIRSFARPCAFTAFRRALEIVSLADIPSGRARLVRHVHGRSPARRVRLQREHITTAALAEEACKIEIEILGRSVGKQDQYISAFGGLSCFEFREDGPSRCRPSW